jgi:hypothetical protein
MAQPDSFQGFEGGVTQPATDGVDVTPNDSVDLVFLPRAITCQVAGNIRVTWPSGVTSNHYITPGAPLAFRVKRILAAGTAATGIAIVK